jgi:uncharacterized membrane protein YdjX (TVP38/TMEM64 family)
MSEVREVERLYLDSIAAARRSIYLENQYFTSFPICAALCARLGEEQGPEVAMVLPRHCSGWLEERVMGATRAEILGRLRAADRHGRFRAYYPVVPGNELLCVNVHSKVFVIDDDFARVGSSNLSNRSMGLDSECDVAVESNGSSQAAHGIARFRARLLGEHLGQTPEAIEAAHARLGSLIAAIAASCTGERRLTELPAEERLTSVALAAAPQVADPEHPVDADEVIRVLLPEELDEAAPRPLLRVGVIVVALLVLGGLWRWTPLADWVRPQHLAAGIAAAQRTAGGPATIVVLYAIGSLVLVPVTLLNLATALAFTPGYAFVYAMAGSLVGAAVSYAAGSILGRDAVTRLAGTHVESLRNYVAHSGRGLVAMSVLRMIPIAPFTVVNLAVGASAIPFWTYFAGTALGMLPGILAITLLVDRVGEAVIHPTPRGVLGLLAVAAVLLLFGGWVKRRLAAARSAAPRSGAAVRAPRRAARRALEIAREDALDGSGAARST